MRLRHLRYTKARARAFESHEAAGHEERSPTERRLERKALDPVVMVQLIRGIEMA